MFYRNYKFNISKWSYYFSSASLLLVIVSYSSVKNSSMVSYCTQVKIFLLGYQNQKNVAPQHESTVSYAMVFFSCLCSALWTSFGFSNVPHFLTSWPLICFYFCHHTVLLHDSLFFNLSKCHFLQEILLHYHRFLCI
jgi:hypothetical protein